MSTRRKGKAGAPVTGKPSAPFARAVDVSAPTATKSLSAANNGSTAAQMSGRKPTAAQLRPPAQDAASNPKPA